MSQSGIGLEQFKAIQEMAASLGKKLAEETFGSSGPGEGVHFGTLEALAAVAARSVLESALGQFARQQAENYATEAPCPDCGCICSLGTEQRPLNVIGGQILLPEPMGHCPVCRRDFFPPQDFSGIGQPQLQPCGHEGHC